MSKLWEKKSLLNLEIENFTVGNDHILDKNLIKYDCLGTIAHAHMLRSMGIISDVEYNLLKKELKRIIALDADNAFHIKKSEEDVHTAVEKFLTESIGDLGKKIHTARSRNDQVAVDMRLYMRNEIFELIEKLLSLAEKMLVRAEELKNIPMPGRTHFQRAMPSSWGLYFGAFAESLLDTILLLQAAYELVNQSPLGSAAGYGVPLPIDRQEVADLLGFEKVQNNVLYVSNSRGKIESIVVHVLSQIMIDLSKLATDFIIFMSPEFGYISLPQELCSGSSLMPQKNNPCGLELVRAKSATVISNLIQIMTIIRGLPSGYNRDFQQTKQPLMESIDITHASLQVCLLTIEKITINAEVCEKSFTSELFATDEALYLVQKGIPFRDAYRQIGLSLENVSLYDPKQAIFDRVHAGGLGNLQLDISFSAIEKYRSWLDQRVIAINKLYEKLLGDVRD